MSNAPAGSRPINFKIGNEKLLKVSESAAKKISDLLKEQHRKEGAQGALRLEVTGGGCSGLQYKMELVEGPADGDILVQSANVHIVIDPKSALFVTGSVLEYIESLQQAGFKVTNPNAIAHCSCGESFTTLASVRRLL